MKQLFTALIYIGIFLSCNSNKNQDKFQFSSSGITDKAISVLQENIELVGEVNSFDLLGESHFVVTSKSPERVMLYDREGNQIRIIGERGEGPFEYLSPEVVLTYNDSIYVFCSSLLKIMVFTRDGTPLKEYKFSKAIRDFRVVENLLYVYTFGDADGPIIQLYDLVSEEFLSEEFGTKSNEHKVLVSFDCSGGMAVKKDKLYFTSVDALAVHQIDMKDMTYTIHEVRDDIFKVERISENHRTFMENFGKSIKYIYNSDIVTGLYAVRDGIVITTEGGEVEMDGLMPVNFYANRFKKYYYLNNDFEFKKGIAQKLSDGQSNCLITSDGLDIYFLKLEEGKSNYNYVLSKMQIEGS